MKDVMGIIYTTKDDLSLRELTSSRAIAAIPVAGRYRMVDFLLSSMVNSGVRNVGVIMQRNYHSLMDHLGSGKEWNLHTRNNGLFILPPFLTRENGGEYLGIMDALRSNVDYLRRSKQEYVILSGSHTVFNTRFNDMLAAHIAHGADITVMYTPANVINVDYSFDTRSSHVFAGLNQDGIVTDLEVNPNAASYSNYCMDVVLMKRTLLMHLADQAFSHGQHDLYKDVLQPCVRDHTLNVYGFEFKGYARRIETVKSYYRFNMDLLNPAVRHELFDRYPVYTKIRDEVPAKYLAGADVKNSLVADGCIIEGTVENCVLFRGVHIAPGVKVTNSILMQDDDIEQDVELDHVILDKDVTIRSGGRLIGQAQYPIVIGKNTTL